MRLVLVRHGQTTSNVADLLDTAEPGAQLTDLGREQARALVEALAGEQVDAVWWSTLVRTHQTAGPLVAALGIEPVERRGLREVQAGDVEMRGDAESIAAFVDVVAAWLAGDVDRRMPGAETGREVLARFDEVVAELAATGARTAVVVSHGAILRYWTAMRAGNIDAATVERRHLSNTGVIVVEGDPRTGWVLLSWEGRAIGGAELTDVAHDGPTA